MYLYGPVLSPGLVGRPNLGMIDRPLVRWEIKKAASEFLEGSRIDVQHNYKGHATVVQSHVTDTQTFFKGKPYPKGTWFITAKVTDPEIQQAIEDGLLTGFSVGAYPEKEFKDSLRGVTKKFVCKSMFVDVGEGEWFALAVSIVDIPFYPEMVFEVLSEEDYIHKSLNHKCEVGKMVEAENSNIYDLVRDMFQTIVKKKELEEDKGDSDKIDKDGGDIGGKLDEILNILKEVQDSLESDKPVKEGKDVEKSKSNGTIRKTVISHVKSLIEDGKIEIGEWDDSNATIEDYKELAVVLDEDADPETKEAYSYLLGKDGKVYSKAVSSALNYANGARGAPKFPELVNALEPLSNLLKEDKEEDKDLKKDNDEGISKSLPLDASNKKIKSLYGRLERDSYGRKIERRQKE